MAVVGRKKEAADRSESRRNATVYIDGGIHPVALVATATTLFFFLLLCLVERYCRTTPASCFSIAAGGWAGGFFAHLPRWNSCCS